MKAIFIFVLLVGCTTVDPSIQSPEKSFRRLSISIQSKTATSEELTNLRQIFAKTGKFRVVDRHEGFKEVFKEQDMQHIDHPERFDDRAKGARFGELHGADYIVMESHECSHQFTPFIILTWWKDCQITLQMVDASTSVIIAVAEDDSMWNPLRKGIKNYQTVVNNLIDNIDFSMERDSDGVKRYMERNLKSNEKAKKYRQDKKKKGVK